MERSRFGLSFAAAAIGLLAASAWARDTSAPKSVTFVASPLWEVEEVVLDPIDVAALLAEDEANRAPGTPYRAGLAREVALAPAHAGTWDSIAGGGSIWRLRVTSPDSLWTNLVFTTYELPPGAELHVYDPSFGFIEGAYSAADNNDFRVLAIPAVPGDSSVIELYLPPGTSGAPDLVLGRVISGYREILTPLPAAAPCTIDINCTAGNNWQDEKRSVARILFNGFLCTGGLLNDVLQDCKNYFLTANHCISSAGDASACIFYWNYEKPGCNSGSGSLSQNQTGSVIRATRSASDFTLLELNTVPSAAFNVYYSGWTNTAAAASMATGISHPTGDVKKISVENNPLADGQWWGSDHWRVNAWDAGVTEGGSSGSGLWNQSSQIVGQLHGGVSACGNPQPDMWDEYGKFSYSWSAGGSSATQLRNWLDPGNTGVVAIGGRYATGCGGCSAPGAPNLNTPTATCTAINLTWSAGSGTTQTYNVYRASSSCGAAFTKIAGPLTTTTYSDATAVGGTTYAYVVRGACDSSGTTESSNSNCRTAARAVAPGAPTGVSASTTSCAQVTVAWASGAGATSHNVLRYNGACPSTTGLTTFTSVSSPFNNTTAAAGSSYCYVVQAQNSCGTTNAAGVTGTRLATPAAPAAPTLTPGCTTMTVAWPAVAGALVYDVHRSTNGTCSGGAFVAVNLSGTTFTDSALTAGTQYSYYIVAKNTCGNSANGACAAATTSAAPAAPSQNAATATCAGVSLSWGSVGGATSYNVLRSAGNCAGGYVSIGTSATNTYTDATAAAGTTYGYVIQAVNVCGASLNSNCRSATAINVPAAPAAPALTPGCTTMTITWTAVGGATLYDVHRSTNGTCTGGAFVATNLAATTFTNTGLTGSTQYSYYVVAKNACGSSTNGACAAAATLPPAPAAPVQNLASATCSGISLSWNNVGGATAYNVLRSAGNCAGGYVLIGTSATNSYSDATAAASTLYGYVIQAVNSCGTSANSNCRSATGIDVPAAPAAPALTPSCTTMTVTWPAVPGATLYDVNRSTNGTCASGAFVAVGLATTTFNDSALTAGTQYSYYIVARNSCGSSGNGACAAAATLAPPAAPTQNAAVAGCTGIALSWNIVGGATSYSVLRSVGNCAGGYVSIGASASNSYNDVTAVAGTTYGYVIRAVNTCGPSANSNCRSATAIGVPAAPAAPTLTPSCTTMALAWSAVPGAATYDVFRAANGTCAGATVIAADLAATAFTDTGRALGTQYSYSIVAKNACGSSANGGCSAATTLNIPATPSLAMASAGYGEVTLGWSDVSGEIGYQVYRGPAGGPFTPAGAILAANTTAYTDTGLTDGTQYCYRIVALNGCGNSANSNERCATPGTCTSSVLFSDAIDGGTGNWALTGSGSPSWASVAPPPGNGTAALRGGNFNQPLECGFASLTVPLAIPAGAPIATLRFYSAVDLLGSDNGIVQISSDGGFTWSKLATVNYPAVSEVVAKGNCAAGIAVGDPVFSGTIAESTYAADLSAYRGINGLIRFTLVTGATSSDTSFWTIDDVVVAEANGVAPAQQGGDLMAAPNGSANRLSWGAVALATSYDVYTTDDPRANLWPDPNPGNTVPPGWSKINANPIPGLNWDHAGVLLDGNNYYYHVSPANDCGANNSQPLN